MDCTICGHQNTGTATACENCGYALSGALGRDSTVVAETGAEVYAKGRMIAGKYRVIRVLGAGGMGVVYLVENTHLSSRRKEALKMIHPHLVNHPEARHLFEREVEICQELVHEDIVRVYDLHGQAEQRFFTMEYVEGKTLRALMQQAGGGVRQFTFPETLAVILPILDVLAYAHQKTVHRDIKPENIMVVGEFPDIRVKVLDFGIAKAMSPSQFTRTAHVMGTAQYMSQEQLSGSAAVDHRADLYAVGVVLYEMLTGKLPVGIFPLPSRAVPGLPAELDRIVARALAYNAGDRYQGAGAMKADLEEVFAGYRASLREREEQVNNWLSGGKSALETGDLRKALAAARRVLEIDGENEAAVSLKTAVEAALERREKLVAEIEAAESGGQLEKALALLADAETAFSDPAAWDEIRSRVQEKLAANERQIEIDALLKQARAALDGCNWPGAGRLFQKALALDRENASARAGLKQAGERDRELKRLVAAAKKAETSERFEEAVSLVEKAQALSPEKKSLDEWRARLAARHAAELKRAKERERRDREMSRLMGDAREAVDKSDWAAAEKHLAEALRLRPDDRRALELQKAIDAGRESERRQARYGELVDAAKAAEKKGNVVDALALFKQAFELRPDEGWLGKKIRELNTRMASAKTQESDTAGLTRSEPKRRKMILAVLAVLMVAGIALILPQMRSEFSPKPPPRLSAVERQDVRVRLEPEKQDKTWTDPVTGMKFVWVPGGCFQMGSPPDEKDRYDDEGPVHEVCVDGFWMGKYEVTQGQWKQVMGSNPSEFKGDDRPVERVSWNDVQKFIRELNDRNGGRFTFRLPTEAEWEYACRSGGRAERYSGGDDVDRVAWYRGNSGGKTHRVGTKAPNGLGIYDMRGNIWEWCADIYAKDAYKKHQRRNPIYTGGGADRVIRGGSWYDEPWYVRCANRFRLSPGDWYDYLGFRLARTK